jgi:hypothetical protein
MWSNQNRSEVAAVSGHYTARNPVTGQLEIRTWMVSFDHFEGEHTGKNIARQVYEKLKKDGLLPFVSSVLHYARAPVLTHRQISAITLDNASNNNTFMDEFAALLEDDGIPFDKDGNRIRFVTITPCHLMSH